MPVLKTLVAAEIKSRFRNMAKVRGLSESELLRVVVLAVTGQEDHSEKPVAPDPEDADTDRMTVRMPRFLMNATKSRAAAKGMAPSRFVTALVQSNLTKQPVMTDAELAVLQGSARELAAIGRNINQMAKAINEAFYETERVRLNALAELSQAIKENRTAIRALVRASQNAWEVDE